MRKEISPEMYNYNKYPGPIFLAFDDIVKSDDLQFTLLENYKNAFNAEVFSQRFSEILLKYDYIVGDWGNEQLRLKGFFKSEKEGDSVTTISRLEDYLKEYCNFGCAYFILENTAPQEIVFEVEEQPRRRRRRRKSSQVKKSQSDFKMSNIGQRQDDKLNRRDNSKTIKNNNQEFTIHQRKG